MADEKISDLTATVTFDDADLATTVQGGVNKKISGASLKTVIGWERSAPNLAPKVPGDNVAIGAGNLSLDGSVTVSSLNTLNGIVQTNGSGLFSTSVTLPDGTLATTQSALDNSTKLATTAYVDTAVSVEDLWNRSGTDLSPSTAGDDVDFGTGALKDNDVTVAVALGDASNTTFDTTNQTILGAVNEVLGDLPNAVEDVFVVANGQTAFVLSSTPSGDPAFALYLNGQLRLRGTDYTQSGTTLTWLDPGSVTLVTTDDLVARFNNTAAVVVGGGGIKNVFYESNQSNTTLTYAVCNISGAANDDFTFTIPLDFTSLVSLKMIFIPTSGASGSGKDIDLTSNYATPGEPANTHSESDVGTVYDFTGLDDEMSDIIDVSVVFSSISAGDYCGLNVDHKGIGGTIGYLGVQLRYT